MDKMKYIKLFENFSYEGKFNLEDFNVTKKWILENVEVVEGDEDYTMDGVDLETLIEGYMGIYKNTKSLGFATVYRLLALNTIDELNTKKLGRFWSFDADCVGGYFVTDWGNKEQFTLTADVDFNYIDWEEGLSSYITFGEAESECTILEGSPIIITHINDEELEDEIEAFV